MLLKMEAYYDGEYWCARALGEDIFTQSATLDELVKNIEEAVNVHFDWLDNPPEVLLLSELRWQNAQIATG